MSNKMKVLGVVSVLLLLALLAPTAVFAQVHFGGGGFVYWMLLAIYFLVTYR
jgi:hypothetical protein